MTPKEISILIVDDNPTLLQVIRKICGRLGIENIHETSNGFDAIAIAIEKTPKLIFMDIEMPFLDFMSPELDGIQTLKMLKTIEATKDIDIIMVSGNLDMDNLTKTLELGAADFISKPFTFDIVKNKLMKLYPDIFSD
jgi:CheY-like chemotaxis protein